VEIGGVCYCWACSAIVAPVAKVEAKPVAPIGQRVEVQAVRACRVREMRAAFKAAQSMGLNTGDACAMRGAIARYLGRVVSSRRDLSGGQWAEVTAGLEMGLVSW
jgi:hypothetical protein